MNKSFRNELTQRVRVVVGASSIFIHRSL